MPQKLPDPRNPGATIEPFQAELTVAVAQKLASNIIHDIDIGETQVELMPGIMVPCWGYGIRGASITSPGPLLEVEANQSTMIRWNNRLPASLMPGQNAPSYPFQTALVPYDDNGTPEATANSPQNFTGIEADAKPQCQRLKDAPVGWMSVHLHGGHTEANSDGWPDNMFPKDGSQLSVYANDSDNADIGLTKRGVFQWYHDHAMNGTGYHVYAGLFGGYLVRDNIEAQLGLPVSGTEGEVLLVIQDRNIVANGMNVQYLHKTTRPVDPNADGGTAEFFGPLTLVNQRIWPKLKLKPNVYRLRVLNGSNARTYRLHLALNRNGTPSPANDRLLIIGTEGGLLWKACSLKAEDTLTIAPAERLDLLIDLTGLSDKDSLVWINSAPAPFQAQPVPTNLDDLWTNGDASNRNPYPQVMQFWVDQNAPTPGKAKSLFDTMKSGIILNPDVQRLVHPVSPSVPPPPPVTDEPPTFTLGSHKHRLILLGEQPTGMLYLQELVADEPNGRIRIQLPDDKTPKGYRVDGWMTGDPTKSADRVAFYDHIAIRPTVGQWELWRFLNTTGDVHPIHIHQALFQPLGSNALNIVTQYLPNIREAAIFVNRANPGRDYEKYERLGWKDTIRVNPNEMVTVAIRFDLPGKYVYHCHILEHEDMMMMRPFVVTVVPLDDTAGTGMPHPM